MNPLGSLDFQLTPELLALLQQRGLQGPPQPGFMPELETVPGLPSNMPAAGPIDDVPDPYGGWGGSEVTVTPTPARVGGTGAVPGDAYLPGAMAPLAHMDGRVPGDAYLPGELADQAQGEDEAGWSWRRALATMAKGAAKMGASSGSAQSTGASGVSPGQGPGLGILQGIPPEYILPLLELTRGPRG